MTSELQTDGLLPRFFIDHGMIHDRVTGRHVDTEPDSYEIALDAPHDERTTTIQRGFGINATLALLNELSRTPPPQEAPAPAQVELKRPISNDPKVQNYTDEGWDFVRSVIQNAAPNTRRIASGEAHIANEWADMATNGVQWLRNIRDGISTPETALAEMEANYARIVALKTAPPPPDRVQPERVEADSKRTITIARLRGITKHLRECPAYANLQGDADWIDEAADFIQNMLVEQYTAYPPTDASGGVTEVRGCPCLYVEPCSYACSCAHPLMSGGCSRCARYGSQEQRLASASRIATALEAADRARKPDTRAQAASADGWWLDVDLLAQEIRRVDGSHSLGAGALAEALMPLLRRIYAAPTDGRSPNDGGYREVTIEDTQEMFLKLLDVGDVSVGEGMVAALKHINAVIRCPAGEKS